MCPGVESAMRKGKKTCASVKVHITELCWKFGMGDYSGVHLQLIRRGRLIPVPCRGCDNNTQSEARRCEGCGQQDSLRSIEARARRSYSLVISEVRAGKLHLMQYS